MKTLSDAPPLSAREFTGVVGSTAGFFVMSSILWLLRPAASYAQMMSSTRLGLLVATELAFAAFWVPRLRRRGWSLDVVTLPAAPGDVLVGVGLFLFTTLLYVVSWVATGLVWPSLIRAASRVNIGGHPGWWAIALVVVINPVAEEFLLLGYIARALEGSSQTIAFWACVAVRVATHLYQGPLALISILPLGLVFGLYYLQNRRIWPVIVAHSILDLLGFARLAGAA